MTEYTLIDCKTELSYGPYETLREARDRAFEKDMQRWEILDDQGRVVDWTPRSTP